MLHRNTWTFLTIIGVKDMRLILMTLSLILLVVPAARADQVPACGSLENNFGPFDYTNVEHLTARNGFQIRDVERNHFTPDVEAGIRGVSSRHAAAAIDYTLRAWPNHHRALLAITRIALRAKTERPVGSRYTIDCWFDRAQRNAPHDGMVAAIFSTYLAKRGRKQEALEQAAIASELSPDSRNVHYNVSVAYLELKEYAKAKEHALRAEELGHPHSGVKKQLQKIGKW